MRIAVGDHASAIDIQLQAMRTATVSGTVTNPERAPAGAQVQLIDPAMPVANVGVPASSSRDRSRS